MNPRCSNDDSSCWNFSSNVPTTKYEANRACQLTRGLRQRNPDLFSLRITDHFCASTGSLPPRLRRLLLRCNWIDRFKITRGANRPSRSRLVR
jgi:hypothetical protein